MSVSASKVAANRLNAQKSTGPKTAEGKAASSRNAMTHGLFSRDLLVGDEDASELAALQASVVGRTRPRDAMEASLVEQYLHCAWRLKRLRRSEQWLLQARSKTSDTPAGKVMFDALQANGDTLERLGRYEQRFFGTMLRCLRELRLLQKEEIDAIEMQNEASDGFEVKVQNEATGHGGMKVQNEATDVQAKVQNEATGHAEVNMQNEATATESVANSSPHQPLPAVVQLPIKPRAARLLAAVNDALHPLRNEMLKRVE